MIFDSGSVKLRCAVGFGANGSRPSRVCPGFLPCFFAACDFSASAIRAFAKNQNIATGIVVGRLQRDKHVPRTHHRDLKKSVSFTS